MTCCFVSSIQCLHSLLELKSKNTMNKEKPTVRDWVEMLSAWSLMVVVGSNTEMDFALTACCFLFLPFSVYTLSWSLRARVLWTKRSLRSANGWKRSAHNFDGRTLSLGAKEQEYYEQREAEGLRLGGNGRRTILMDVVGLNTETDFALMTCCFLFLLFSVYTLSWS
jgi:hypothetical protein